MKNYKVNFGVSSGNRTEFCGFEIIIPGTDGFGDPGWDYETIYHDIFEHWFEGSSLFNTPELSINGEAVAMGIRESMYSYHGITELYAGYNPNKGIIQNSWTVISSLISESKAGNSQYSVNLSPSYDTRFYNKGDWKNWQDIAKHNLKMATKKEIKAICKAYEIGFNWATEVIDYDAARAIENFMENWKLFSVLVGIEGKGTYEVMPNLVSMDVSVNHRKADIRATINGWADDGLPSVAYISSNMNESQVGANASRLFGRKLY